MTTKLTDRKIYEAIMDGKLDTLDTDAIAAWAEKKIAQLDHKAEKAKEIAARKRSEGDELAAAVMAAVGDADGATVRPEQIDIASVYRNIVIAQGPAGSNGVCAALGASTVEHADVGGVEGAAQVAVRDGRGRCGAVT